MEPLVRFWLCVLYCKFSFSCDEKLGRWFGTHRWHPSRETREDGDKNGGRCCHSSGNLVYVWSWQPARYSVRSKDRGATAYFYSNRWSWIRDSGPSEHKKSPATSAWDRGPKTDEDPRQGCHNYECSSAWYSFPCGTVRGNFNLPSPRMLWIWLLERLWWVAVCFQSFLHMAFGEAMFIFPWIGVPHFTCLFCSASGCFESSLEQKAELFQSAICTRSLNLGLGRCLVQNLPRG